MRALGVDFGGVRIGLAVGESTFGITTARLPLKSSGTLSKDALSLVEKAKQEQAEAIVLGVPFEADLSTGKMAKVCLMLAEKIKELGFDVYIVDEALTSVEAESNLRTTDLTAAGRRRLRDGEAARLILERFFDAQKGL